MKKIAENTKVTLTLKQLKKLVKESNNDEFSHWFELALKNLKNRVADLEEVFSSVKKGAVTPVYVDQFTDLIDLSEKSLKFMLKLLGEVKSSEVKEGIDDEDEGTTDVDAAVKDLFDMYQACKVEPKVCNAIKADGEKTSIFLDKGNSVGGIARALRDGRLLKVIGFN